MNLINIIEEEANKYKLDIKNINNIFNKLGEGGFGKVYEKNGLAYKITEDESEYYFSKKIKAKQNLVSAFPIIYEVYENPKIDGIYKEKNYYIIVREVVDPVELHPTLKSRFSNWVYKIRDYINSGDNEILKNIIQNSKLPEEYINFIIKLKEDNFKLNRKYNGIDFHSGNIGINGKGDLVLFDF